MANVDVRFVAYCPCGVSTGTRLGTCADSGREREYRKRENQRPRAGVKNIVNRAVGVERSGQHAYRLACMGLPPSLIRCVVGERQFEFDASGRHVEYADAAAMRTVRPHMVGPRDACPAVRRERDGFPVNRRDGIRCADDQPCEGIRAWQDDAPACEW